MAYSTIEKYCHPIEKLLKRSFEPGSKNLREGRKALLLCLLTASIPESFPNLLEKHRIRGIKKQVIQLIRYLREFSNVPEAFCAKYKYKMSSHRVKRRYNISKRTWEYIHRLASEADFNMQYQLSLLDFKKFPWYERLEETMIFTDIVLDIRALNDMLVAIYEAYLAPRKKRRKGCEVYGLNLGMIRTTEVQAERKGITIQKYISVMRSAPQISATADWSNVKPNDQAVQAVIKANMTLFPHNQILGDFHSHPYATWNELLRSEGWEYSEGDQTENYTLARRFAQQGHPISLTFVVAIAKAKRKIKRRHFRGKKNMIQLRVGKCCAIVAVYRSLERGTYSDKNIRLILPGMVL
ncbi:hypothetical protein ACFLUV_03780 [Elusimicrobiota bacterium]